MTTFPNHTEWLLWIALNGTPAIFAGLMFVFNARFDKFGWDVAPRGMGILFGAGFLFRAAMYLQLTLATHYSQTRWLHWGNVIFAAVLLATTLVYGDRFVWSRFIALAWTFLYIEEPVWMLTLWPRSEIALATLAPEPSAGVNMLLQIALLVEAGIMLVWGLYVFLINRRGDQPGFFPFKPDFTSGRIWSGFPLAWSAWSVALAFSSWFDARGGVLVNLVWLGVTALCIAAFSKQYGGLGHRPTQRVLVMFVALFVLVGAGVLIQGA